MIVTDVLEGPDASIFSVEGGGNVVLQNIGNHIPDYPVSHPRRQYLSCEETTHKIEA
jgi:hypothetical protein